MTTHTPTLSGKKNFQTIFQEGRSLVSRELVLYYMANQKTGNLVAFCVGKTIGSAVDRNRTKRRMREAFRLWDDRVLHGYTLAWVARTQIKRLSFEELTQKMGHLINRANLLQTDGE